MAKNLYTSYYLCSHWFVYGSSPPVQCWRTCVHLSLLVYMKECPTKWQFFTNRKKNPTLCLDFCFFFVFNRGQWMLMTSNLHTIKLMTHLCGLAYLFLLRFYNILTAFLLGRAVQLHVSCLYLISWSCGCSTMEKKSWCYRLRVLCTFSHSLYSLHTTFNERFLNGICSLISIMFSVLSLVLVGSQWLVVL